MPVIPLPTGQPTYQGEVLLLGWSENNRDGMTVRFALDATDEGTHPFKGLGTGKMGQRFMMVAVPLGDDEQPQIEAPAAPIPAAQAHAAGKPKPAGQKWDECKYAKQVSTACGDPEFREWLRGRAGSVAVPERNEAVAEVKRIVGIESRKELDADPEGSAVQRWNELHGEFKRQQREQIGQAEAEAQARAYAR